MPPGQPFPTGIRSFRDPQASLASGDSSISEGCLCPEISDTAKQRSGCNTPGRPAGPPAVSSSLRAAFVQGTTSSAGAHQGQRQKALHGSLLSEATREVPRQLQLQGHRGRALAQCQAIQEGFWEEAAFLARPVRPAQRGPRGVVGRNLGSGDRLGFESSAGTS